MLRTSILPVAAKRKRHIGLCGQHILSRGMRVPHGEEALLRRLEP
jgi:hypothetical protein